jgi:hypothetical protein
MRRLLELANSHVVELPDAPWLAHVHNAFQNKPQDILKAACQRTGFHWDMRKLYSSDKWIGTRELWYLSRQPGGRSQCTPTTSLGGFFGGLLLPPPDGAMNEEISQLLADAFVSQPLVQKCIVDTDEDMGTALPIIGTLAFVQDALAGKWENSQGRIINIDAQQDFSESETRCQVRYLGDNSGTEFYPLAWTLLEGSNTGAWVLKNHAGTFVLARVSSSQLRWRALADRPWLTCWKRCNS